MGKKTAENNYKYTGPKPDHISATQIERGRCLYKYMRSRLQGDELQNEPMREGKFVHEVIYRYTKFCVESKTVSDFEEFNRIFDEEFTRAQLPETIYTSARENLIKWAERGIEFDKILDYEERHTVEFEPGKKIMAVFDRTNSYTDERGSILEIIDYKNSMKILTNTEVEKHEQLRIYKHLAANYIYKNFDYIRCGIYHTRYDRMRWTDMQHVRDMTGEFENTEKMISRQWARLIESEEYPPEEGDQCWEYGGCPYMIDGSCPLYTPDRVHEMAAAGDLESQIRAYRKMDHDAKQLKKTIQKQFETRIGIEVDGKFTGYKLSPSYKYELAQLIEYFEKYDIKNYTALISKTDAERMIIKGRGVKINKLQPEEYQEIQDMQTDASATRFNI